MKPDKKGDYEVNKVSCTYCKAELVVEKEILNGYHDSCNEEIKNFEETKSDLQKLLDWFHETGADPRWYDEGFIRL